MHKSKCELNVVDCCLHKYLIVLIIYDSKEKDLVWHERDSYIHLHKNLHDEVHKSRAAIKIKEQPENHTKK